MNQENHKDFNLPFSPIVEAVIDIDCDLPPNLDFHQVEKTAKAALAGTYPKTRRQMLHAQSITPKDNQSFDIGIHQNLQAIQFRSEDEKQLTQYRKAGYSFNRLSPYEGLDKYLHEIERTWNLFVDIAKPVKIRKIGLRTINRILLPIHQGALRLEDYLATGPELPRCHNLTFTGFLNQHMAIDPETKHQVTILMSTQPIEGKLLPLILDIDAFSGEPVKDLQWESIQPVVQQIRTLKNDVFKSILTKQCQNLFTIQQP